MEADARVLAITAIAPIAWGTNYYVTRQQLPAGFPLYGGVFRALPAGLMLLAISRRLPHSDWWWRSLVLGALNVGAFFVLVYAAAQRLPSSVAATVMATSAGVIMVVARIVLRERLRILPLTGAGIGLIGVCFMLWTPTGPVDLIGVGYSLAAMLLSSIGYVLSKRWSHGVPVLALTAWQLIAGGVLLTPFAVILEGSPPHLSARAVLSFSYVTTIATAVAFAAWFTGLKYLRSSAVAVIGLLNPVTGVLLGTLLASEPFGLRQAAGVLLVLIGVLVGQRGGGTHSRARPGVGSWRYARLKSGSVSDPSSESVNPGLYAISQTCPSGSRK